MAPGRWAGIVWPWSIGTGGGIRAEPHTHTLSLTLTHTLTHTHTLDMSLLHTTRSLGLLEVGVCPLTCVRCRPAPSTIPMIPRAWRTCLPFPLRLAWSGRRCPSLIIILIIALVNRP